jgi:Bardet-Biedl syndrome 4 protein
MLGDTYGKMGNYEESLIYYEASLEINPNRYESLFAVAALMQAQGQIEKAFEKYTVGYNFAQNSAAFWNNLASLMLEKKKEIAAYSCLKKALFLDPFRWDIHTNLGLTLMKVKK